MMASLSDFMIRVKCKKRAGLTLTTLSAENTVNELKEQLSKELNMLPSDLKILCGYPPKMLADQFDDCMLKDVEIHSGDTIVVENKTHIKKSEIAKPALTSSEPPHNFSMGDMPAIFEDIYSGGSIMLRQMIPATHSSLFTSVHYLLYGNIDVEKSADVRKVLINEVTGNPYKYSTQFLGMKNEDYCKWIQNTDNWGGAIELAILSNYFKFEITVIYVPTLVMRRFGKEANYKNTVFLICEDDHYEPLGLETGFGYPQYLFDVKDKNVLNLVKELAEEAKASHHSTCSPSINIS